ncbi:MAG: hypothetical protein ACFE9Q_11325 [Candidatus Hodarchaeota archaeon]
MNSKTVDISKIKIQKSESSSEDSDNKEPQSNKMVNENIEDICDENLTTLQKIHAILLNCVNLSKKQKLEFCESERYFMKLYLKKVQDKNRTE